MSGCCGRKLAVSAILSTEKLRFGAMLENSAILHHNDAMCISDGCESVGNYERCATVRQFSQRLLNGALGLGVQRRGRLIENEDRWILQKDAGNRQTLLLTTR